MKSIRSRITALVILAVVISVLAIGIISVKVIRNSEREASLNLLRLTCEQKQLQLDAYFDSIEQSVDTVLHFAEDQYNDESDEAFSQYISSVDTLFHSVANNTNGVYIYYYRIDPDLGTTNQGFWYTKYDSYDFELREFTDIKAYDEYDREHVGWYYSPKQKGYALWLDPYANENLGGTKMISYVTPVYHDGKFVGVIGIDVDYRLLENRLKNIEAFETGYAVLTNADDKVIYHPEIKAGTPIGSISDKLKKSNLVRANQLIEYTYGNQDKIACWANLSNDMKLFLVVPMSEINETWHNLLGYVVMFSIVILIIFIGLTTLIANHITKPLSDLTDIARRLNDGDYDVSFDYDRDDEIGVLTNTFHQLSDHLKIYIGDLSDRAYKDALTSVRNKGAFDVYLRKLEDRIANAGEMGEPEFAICMFDCNNLKIMNDNYGHDKGDIYLKNACALICDIFAHSPVFRLGGDEFVTVLEGDDFINRLELCTEFDRRVAESCEQASEPWETVNLASGIAVYAADRDKTAGEVLKRADKRMYEDKARKKQGIVRELDESMVSY